MAFSPNNEVSSGKSLQKAIGIFQYNFVYQSYVGDFVVGFANAGYEVHFFIDSGSLNHSFADKQKLDHPGVKVIDLAEYEKNIRIRFLERSTNYLQKLIFGKKDLVQKSTISATKKNIRKKTRNAENYPIFTLLVGIEKQGLIWAGIFSEQLHVPFAYFSLELLLEDYQYYKDYEWMRPYERHYHSRAALTIVQDPQRAAVLLQANGVPSNPVCYYPVSVSGSPNHITNNYFHKKFNISRENKIVLYFGLFSEERECSQLAELAHQLVGAVLVFHGYGIFGSNVFYEKFRYHRNVYFSLDLVEEEMIDSIVSSADVGVSLYNENCMNDMLTAFSSLKNAIYMKNGVPMIAYQNESYDKLFGSYKCGRAISDVAEFPDAVAKILSQPGSYRNECYKAFQEVYSLDRNMGALLSCIGEKFPG